MHFWALAGTTLFSHILFWSALSLSAILITATLFTILYHRFWYVNVVQPKYPKNYTPSCAIVLPCKGIVKDLDKNLQSFLDQEYPDFSIVFTVESEKDPAYAAICDLIKNQPRAKVVVAGLAQKCCQKNFNMIAAIKQVGNVEVYVFADSDIGPNKQWLRQLVQPLSSKNVSATSGFRWLHFAKNSPIRHQAHIQCNSFLYTLWAFACFVGNVGLWGGSMAIRKRDYEELEVEKCWSNTTVDDMSLAWLITKNGRKTVLVPPCVTESDDIIDTVSGTVRWFWRQCVFLKACYRWMWAPGFPFGLMLLFLQLWIVPSLVLFFVNRPLFHALGGSAAGIMLASDMLMVLLYPFLGKVPNFMRYVVCTPFFRIIPILAFVKTLPSRKFSWGGIAYSFNWRGKVTSVTHPD